MDADDRWEDEPDPAGDGYDVVDQLATMLGIAWDEFVEVFGAGWDPRPVEVTPEGPWFVAGRPPQLILRPCGTGVDLAVPEGSWDGVVELRLRPRDPEHLPDVAAAVADGDAQAVVARLLKRRRSSFRYCRYCREVTPPERMLGDGVCQGCGSRVLGVVY